MAGDIRYHRSCKTALFNQARVASSESEKINEPGLTYDPLVIAELVAYIQQHRCAVKLVDLRSLYAKRLIEKKSDWIESNVNATMFKYNLLEKLGNEWQWFQESEYAAEVLMDNLKNLKTRNRV